MCVFAAGATGLLGLGGSASNVFLASLGIQGAQMVNQNRIARQQTLNMKQQEDQQSQQTDLLLFNKKLQQLI